MYEIYFVCANFMCENYGKLKSAQSLIIQKPVSANPSADLSEAQYGQNDEGGAKGPGRAKLRRDCYILSIAPVFS